MLTLPATVRIFVALDAVDLRGSFDALAGHVRRLGADPLDGHLYVFVNVRRTLMKVLWFDRNGWAVHAKRLERGTFQLPDAPGVTRVAVDPAQLAMMLEGIDLRAPRRLRYQPPSPSP
ncbi:MAG: IS66 family insertion sequence element accessory protein TnpB [Dehalococcoidia bacterium]|nr:IS66 family insertion sequence element accessory protein TnpB [Myxococcales bacterium]MCA9857404.1 IS66 family insertion sequence element accessory protein TnpB [Dehalococcoidia bacterium]MCB9690122.1 IS66 family insertion sequence element accessory protein TnpB [Alphaproteobacteria bacterium]